MSATTVYVGRREAMIAEVAAFDFTCIGVSSRASAYAMLPVGDAQYDTEYASTKAEALRMAREMARALGAKVTWVD